MSDLDLSNPYDPDQYRREPLDPAVVPLRPVRAAEEIAASPAVPPSEPAPDDPPAAPTETTPGAASADARAVPWKAAASSVPKLRQQPAPLPEPPAGGAFQGFAQDALGARNASEFGSEGGPDRRTSPLSADLPLWEAWLERARTIPKQAVIGVAGAILIVVVVSSFLFTRGEPSIPLAKIRQHPEAFDGRLVKVQGRAGETFIVGGNYVFDLRQGRDTIVVYSHTRRPSLHERVQATGTVSIGYLDGAPRLALFESPQTP